MTLLQLPQIDCAGSPRACGQAQGEALRDEIQAFVAQRLRAAKVYLYERNVRGIDGLLAAGRDCLASTRAWFPAAAEEHAGIAEAAGVDSVELFSATNMTDVRDVVLYPATPTADAEGCTSFIIPPELSADDEIIAAQTWDLNPGDLDYVVAIHRRPDEGPETWSVTCAGSLSLVGLNDAGLWVGTTNIKTSGTRVGVPYLALLHRSLSCQTVAEASAALRSAPRAAAHTYWFADARSGVSFECSADRAIERPLTTAGLCQTNHCLEPEHIDGQAEPTGSSSAARLARAQTLLAAGNHDVASVQAIFRDRSDGVDSINRFPEDDQGTATNSCMIAIPARRELHACKGPADRGEWVRLAFG